MPRKEVVAGVECSDLDLHASVAKPFDHAATTFVDVCEDAATLSCGHPTQCERESSRGSGMCRPSNHLSTERRKMA
jgi:hypothetical protein